MSVHVISPSGPENPEYVRWVSLPTRQEAFDAQALTTLSAKLEIPEPDIRPSVLSEYKNSLLSTHAVAQMVNIHISHRLWPQVLEGSQAQPEFSIEFRGHANLGRRAIKTANFYHQSDVGKFLLAAAKFDRPEGALTVQELAAEVGTTTHRLDQFLVDNEITTKPYRHPEAEEFDEFITPEVVAAILRVTAKAREPRK